MKISTHYYPSLFLLLFSPCFISAAMPSREFSSSRPPVEMKKNLQPPDSKDRTIWNSEPHQPIRSLVLSPDSGIISLDREITKIKQYSDKYWNYLMGLSFWEELFDKGAKKGLYMRPGWKRSEDSPTEATSLRQRIEEFLAKKEEKVFALLSERGGSGKSVFAQMLEKEMWRKQIWIPIYIPLVGLGDVNKSIEAFILREMNVDPSKLFDLQQEQVLFILDGYDELPVEKRINLYQKNKLYQWTNSKTIITSRAQAIPRSQYQQIFSPQPREGGYYDKAYLAPFSEKQAYEYLHRFVEYYPDRMCWSEHRYIDEINRIPLLTFRNPDGLAKLPIFLRLIAEALPEAIDRSDRENIEFVSSTLFEEFTKKWFKREYHKELADTEQVFSSEADAAEKYDIYAMILASKMDSDNIQQFQHTIVHTPQFPVKRRRRKKAAAPLSYWNKVFSEHDGWNRAQNKLAFRALPLQRVRGIEDMFRFWHSLMLAFFVEKAELEFIT